MKDLGSSFCSPLHAASLQAAPGTAGSQPAAPLSLPGWGWVGLYPQGPQGPGITSGPGCLHGSGITAGGVECWLQTDVAINLCFQPGCG